MKLLFIIPTNYCSFSFTYLVFFFLVSKTSFPSSKHFFLNVKNVYYSLILWFEKKKKKAFLFIYLFLLVFVLLRASICYYYIIMCRPLFFNFPHGLFNFFLLAWLYILSITKRQQQSKNISSLMSTSAPISKV